MSITSTVLKLFKVINIDYFYSKNVYYIIKINLKKSLTRVMGGSMILIHDLTPPP